MAVADHTVRRATGADAGAITRILAASFHDDPPLMWIIPDAADRQRLSPAFFRPFVDLVLTGGEAYMTDQGTKSLRPHSRPHHVPTTRRSHVPATHAASNVGNTQNPETTNSRPVR